MFLDHPIITATSASTEPDRIERLNRIYGYVAALADQAGATEMITRVEQIHDHRGTLMVVWRVQPDPSEKSFFQKAWNSKLGDSSGKVEHEVRTASPR